MKKINEPLVACHTSTNHLIACNTIKMKRFNEDINNINYYILKNLSPYARSDPTRTTRLQISSNFYKYLKAKLSLNSRFKSGVAFSIKCHLPTIKQIEANKRCEIDLGTLQVRIWQPKSKVYVPKPSITIRFIRKDIFLI